jgi:hypothetical protein
MHIANTGVSKPYRSLDHNRMHKCTGYSVYQMPVYTEQAELYESGSCYLCTSVIAYSREEGQFLKRVIL